MNREDSAKVGGWLDHASKMARTVAEHNAEEAIAALLVEREQLRKQLAKTMDALMAGGELRERFVERTMSAEAAISSVRALVDAARDAELRGASGMIDWRDLRAALDSSGTPDPIEQTRAAIAAVRARCDSRTADGCTYIRIADVLDALGSSGTVEDAPEERT